MVDLYGRINGGFLTNLGSIGGSKKTVNKTIYDTSSLPTFNLPNTTPGDPIPLVYGQRRISSPKIAYYGNLQPVYSHDIKEQTYSGKGSMGTTGSQMDQLINEGGGGDGASDVLVKAQQAFGTVGISHSDNSKNPWIDDILGANAFPHISVTYGPSYVNHFFEKVTTDTVTLTDYSVDIMFAVCLGPDTRLLAIYSGDEQIWSGDIGPARQEVANDPLTQPLLGNGFIWYGGSFEQTPDSYLRAGADDPKTLSAFPGIAYIAIKSIGASVVNGASFSFEVIRPIDVLGLGTGSASGGDQNGANAMVEIMTNEWGGMGIDTAYVDVDSFRVAGAKFATEGLYFSDILASDSDGSSSFNNIVQATRSFVYQDPSSGLITIALERPTLSVDNPPKMTLTPANVTELQDVMKPDWASIPQGYEVDFTDRSNKYATTPVYSDNPAAPPPLTRKLNKATLALGNICTATVAVKALELNMSAGAAPKLSMTAICNRQAARMLPGQFVFLTWPEYGIADLPFTVQSTREFDSNQIALKLQQYQFLGIAGGYVKPAEPSQHTPKDLNVRAPTDARLESAPYVLVCWADPSYTGSYQQWNVYDNLLCMVEPGNDYQPSFQMYDYAKGVPITDQMSYTPTARLVSALAIDAGKKHHRVNSIVISTPKAFGLLRKTQSLDDIRGWGSNGSRPILIFLGDEILSYESLVDNGNGTWTLNGVHRALLDTIMSAHAAGDKLWFYDCADGSRMYQSRLISQPDPRVYGFVGTGLSGGKSNLADAPHLTTVVKNRVNSPYPIVDVRINGQDGSNGPINYTIGTPFEITWKLRTRAAIRVSLFDDDSDIKEQLLQDDYYNWQPVVWTVLIKPDNSTVQLANSRDAWERTSAPDDTMSTATGIFDMAPIFADPIYGAAGLCQIAWYTGIYDYSTFGTLRGPGIGVDSLPVYFLPANMIAGDLTVDYATGIASDLTMDYDMLFTLPTLTR